MVTHAEGVVVTTVGIAVAVEALIGVGSSTASTNTVLADVVLVVTGLAAVRGQGERVTVGLPDVNLTTACSESTNAGVLVAGRRLPALIVALGITC